MNCLKNKIRMIDCWLIYLPLVLAAAFFLVSCGVNSSINISQKQDKVIINLSRFGEYTINYHRVVLYNSENKEVWSIETKNEDGISLAGIWLPISAEAIQPTLWGVKDQQYIINPTNNLIHLVSGEKYTIKVRGVNSRKAKSLSFKMP